MKAECLMIGDWVNLNFDIDYKTGESIYAPVQVTGINKDGTVDVNCTFDKSESIQDGWDLKQIEPIPLTSDIFEKNEFKKFGEHYIMIWCENYSVLATKVKDTLWTIHIQGDSANMDGGVTCVHELQNAMKVCGIEKKIEI